MESSLLSDSSDCSRRHHHHVPKLFALTDTTPEKEETQSEEDRGHQQDQQEQNHGQPVPTTMIQLVRPGEGKDRMSLPNFFSSSREGGNGKEVSFHRPILVRDTPESIGMQIPKGGEQSQKKKQSRKKTPSAAPPATNQNTGNTNAKQSVPFSIRDVADVVGHSSPVQMINVLNQTLEDDLSDWTFNDMVEYFEDRQRLGRSGTLQQVKKDSASTTSEQAPKSPSSSGVAAISSPPHPKPQATIVSPLTGRSRRKAAIRSEESFHNIIHNENFSGIDSKRILNQISYEFSGTPLHAMVRSPTVVRDIDWIDHAWPAERKPKHILPGYSRVNNEESGSSNSDRTKTKGDEKAQKGKNSLEYPAVQYYCLTSAASSYTDFHIDFGGSSVWYHVIRGQKIFVVSPPTRQNLRVYEEWLCHPNQAEIFLPDMMKERACPDIHCYSSNDNFSSTSSYSSASTAATYASSAALGDLADEMAFFRNSLKNTLSTNNALRFTLNEGETLVLPAGWIHAVYTTVDSLVFGGNFLHGLDIQMQLTVNAIEARTRVLGQYRFPHFGALQMYAGGMYLQRLRATGKAREVKLDDSNQDQDNRRETTNTPTEQEEGQQPIETSGKMNHDNTYSNMPISTRELEELPMLMNALEFWWMSKEEKDIDGTNREEIGADSGFIKTPSAITSLTSFREAALYVANQNGCDSVEIFIAALRNEYARVSTEQWGSLRVAPSDHPNSGTLDPSSSLSTIPIAIGKPKKKKITVESVVAGIYQKKKREKPRCKNKRKRPGFKSDLDDPLDVVLSKNVKEYLASIQITTAAQLLLAKTTDVAKNLQEWRKQKGMAELKGRAGAVASVSVWKRKVRLRAAMVGAKKLAQLNEGTNMKPLGFKDEDDRKPPPSKDNTK